jgi:hypothetical protein
VVLDHEGFHVVVLVLLVQLLNQIPDGMGVVVEVLVVAATAAATAATAEHMAGQQGRETVGGSRA